MAIEIDINCDMGESYGQFTVGNDELIFPFITSCNIACGFHGGDPLHIEKTIKNALKHNVQIGAHPSYPDLAGFGRRPITMPSAELHAIVKYQIAALKGMVESEGGRLSYVKPHGALYNKAANDEKEAIAVIESIKKIDPTLALMGLSGSKIEKLAIEYKMPFIAEAFADRGYTDEGTLVNRNLAGAVINNPEKAADQVLSIASQNKVSTSSGTEVAITAKSFCIHGDNPKAVEILKAIHKMAKQRDIKIKAFSTS